MSENFKQIIGAESFETAALVSDYPYGWLRTEAKYWIETKQGYGQRLVFNTCNPKTGRWNAPKKSTYSPLLLLGYETQADGREFVVSKSVDTYGVTEQELLDVPKAYTLTEYQLKALKFLIVSKRAESLTTWTVSEETKDSVRQTREEQLAIYNTSLRMASAELKSEGKL